MSRRNKWLLLLGGLAVVGLTVAGLFWHEIQIAYHRNRLFAAADNYSLLCWQPVRTATKLEALNFLVFRMTAQKEQDAMEHHKAVLLRLHHFNTQEFVLTNRTIKADWVTIRSKATNAFTRNQWWSITLLETNRITVMATPTDLRRWEQLISELDR